MDTKHWTHHLAFQGDSLRIYETLSFIGENLLVLTTPPGGATSTTRTGWAGCTTVSGGARVISSFTGTKIPPKERNNHEFSQGDSAD